MEGFKKLPKMQHFKIGGSVAKKFASLVEKTFPASKPAEPKVAKAKSAASAVPKEKEKSVDVSTLKKGGRAKKAVGTVKKFEKAAAPSKAEVKAKGGVGKEKSKASGNKDPIKKVKAPKVKKFAVGGGTGNAIDAANNAVSNATSNLQTQFHNDLSQPQNAWIGKINEMNAQNPFQRGVVNHVDGLPPFRIGDADPAAEQMNWENNNFRQQINPNQYSQENNQFRGGHDDLGRGQPPVQNAGGIEQARGRWNPQVNKGGSPVQPPPFPNTKNKLV